MIKIFNAHTSELHDSGKAVSEILEQLNIGNNLKRNSAGLIFCHAEFIETGIAQAVCKSLPFDILGCTSQYLAVPAKEGRPEGKGHVMLTESHLAPAR